MEKNEPDNIFQRLYSYISGHKSKTMYITIGKSNESITVPWLLAVLCLLVFDIPSWVLGVLLILLVAFDLDLNIKDSDRSEKSRTKKTAVKKTDQNKAKKQSSRINVDDEGFCEIIIN